MFDRYIDLAAKMARLMYNMGKEGSSPQQALQSALSQIPASAVSQKLKEALRREFGV